MSLINSLGIGLSSLQASQAGLETAGSNVANVNTPGYARRRLDLAAVVVGNDPRITSGLGVRTAGMDRVRSDLLDARVASSESSLAGANASLRHLSALENTIAPGGQSSIGSAIGRFFGSMEQLSVRPEDSSLRAATLDAARGAAQQISTTARGVQAQVADLHSDLNLGVRQLNQMTSELAAINRQIGQANPVSTERAALEDRQTALISEIATKVDARSYRAENGSMQLTLGNGTPLVIDDDAFQLTVDGDPYAGAVRFQGTDVSSGLKGGEIGGLLAARDGGLIPALEQLDALAAGLTSSVNTQHALGFDGNGAAGGDMFVAGLGTTPGSTAGGMSSLLTDPATLAAGSTPAPGDGGNANALAALGSAANTVSTPDGPRSYAGAVADMTLGVGLEAQQMLGERDAAGAMRTQAVNARETLSGVSLDEEAASMIRFQRAFEASTRFLSTINDLMSEVVNMVR